MATVIRTDLPPAPVAGVPEIRLHLAQASSGLRRLYRYRDCGSGPPYWAYVWAGGLALARHILDHPGTVAGRRVLDFGTGSGLAAIAAAKAGARTVSAFDTDRGARVATALNAEANGVDIEIAHGDAVDAPAPAFDLIVAGDVFYDAEVAERSSEVLDRFRLRGAEVLIGDPGRAYLPRDRLRPLAEYPTGDVGEGRAGRRSTGVVYVLAA